MSIEITVCDAADHLTDRESIAAYLDAALEDGDSELLKAALGDVARSKGITEIAEANGLSRTSLYKTVTRDGNPEFATIVKVLHALGLRIGVRSAA